MIEPTMMLLPLPGIEVAVHESCGMQLLLLPDQNSGDAVCGSTFEDIEVPPIELTSPDTQGMKPDVPESTIQEAERLRDLFCGIIIAVGLIGASCCLSCCCWALCSRHFWEIWCRSSRTATHKVGALPAVQIGQPSVGGA